MSFITTLYEAENLDSEEIFMLHLQILMNLIIKPKLKITTTPAYHCYLLSWMPKFIFKNSFYNIYWIKKCFRQNLCKSAKTFYVINIDPFMRKLALLSNTDFSYISSGNNNKHTRFNLKFKATHKGKIESEFENSSAHP